MRSTIVVILTTLFVWQGVKAEDSVFKPIAAPKGAGGEEFFKIENGEARIDAEVIKLIVVKPEYLTASYKNDSAEGLFPKCTVKTYNRYGYLLGSDEVGPSMFGGSSKLEAGDVGGEKIRVDLIDLKEVFLHTELELPEDFFEAAWLSLSASNSRLTDKEPGPGRK